MSEEFPKVPPTPPVIPVPPDPDPNRPREWGGKITWQQPQTTPVPPLPTTPPTVVSPIDGQSSWNGSVVNTFNGVGEFVINHETEIRQGVIIAGVAVIAAVTAPIWVPATVEAIGAVGLASLANAARLGLAGGGFVYGMGGAPALAENSPNQSDPILLDLNGDGVQTTNFSNSLFFDHDNNGFAELSTWVDANDGILFRDLNNNGILDNGTEIFGNNTILSNGAKAQDGYDALSDLDSNQDGVIDSRDDAFASLKILKGDGTLLTLQQANIKSFNLAHTNVSQVDINGNTLVSQGSYTKLDNTLAQMGDFNLLTNTAISNPLTAVNVPADIAALPDAMGSGNVYDLHQAMAMDASGQLKDMVQTFVQSSSALQQNILLDQILAKWAGIPYNDDIRSGGMLFAMHAAVVEKFEGHAFRGQEDSFIGTVPAGYVAQGYNELRESLYGKLMAQTQLKDYFGQIQWAQDATTQQYSLNLSPVTSMLQQLAQTNRAQAITTAAEFSRALNGLKWSLVSNYPAFYTAMSNLGSDFQFAIDTADKQVVIGTSNDDTLGSQGLGAWDAGSNHYSRDVQPFYLDGGAGNDTLKGSYNSDILVLGPGNDSLEGFDGNDTYIFNKGAGQDVITEGNAFIKQSAGGYDVLLFGSDVSKDDVVFTANGNNDLLVTLKSTGDQVTITQEFDPNLIGYQVEAFAFGDGTSYTVDQLKAMLQTLGTSGADYLYGSDLGERLFGYAGDDYIDAHAGNDILDGGDGNDRLYGNDGNDTLIGGLGNDYLSGDAGDDVYQFATGFGQDTLQEGGGTDSVQFGANLLSSNAIFSAYGNNLIIDFKNSTDQLVVQSQLYDADLSYRVESFKFGDGISYTTDQIKAMLQTLGTTGADSLSG